MSDEYGYIDRHGNECGYVESESDRTRQRLGIGLLCVCLFIGGYICGSIVTGRQDKSQLTPESKQLDNNSRGYVPKVEQKPTIVSGTR